MKNSIIALAVMLSALTALCQIGRVSNITCDIARNSTYSCRFTAMTDAAVMANIQYNSSEFDVSGWTGIFFIGDGHGGMAITNTAREFSSFTFSIPVSSIPTNGTYYSQLIGYKNGRIEEWGRGIVVVDGNYSDGTLPAEWIREHPIYQIATQALEVANNAYQLVAGQSNVFWAIISSIPSSSITSNDMARWNQAHEATTNIPSLAKGMTNYVDNLFLDYKAKRLYNPTNSLEWTEIRGDERWKYTVLTTYSNTWSYSCPDIYDNTTKVANAQSGYFEFYPPPVTTDKLIDGLYFEVTGMKGHVVGDFVVFKDSIWALVHPFGYNYVMDSVNVDTGYFAASSVGAVIQYVGVSCTTNIVKTSLLTLSASDSGLFRDVATNVIWRKVVSNGWEYLIAHTNYTAGGAQ